jgi:hypothetical protein
MSSDETDIGSVTKTLRKVALDFRLPSLTDFLHTLDTYPLCLLRSLLGSRGNRAILLKFPPIMAHTDPKDVPAQWPINYYNIFWLQMRNCSASGRLLAAAAEELPKLVRVPISYSRKNILTWNNRDLTSSDSHVVYLL